MRRLSIRLHRSIRGAWLGTLLLGGCVQGAEESCQVDSDCENPLVCQRAAGSDRGRCRDASRIENRTPLMMDAAIVEPVLPPDPVLTEDAG